MNVIDYALHFEEEGKKYYNEQALRAKKDEIRSLFLMLANDEDRHYKIIEKFKEGVYEYLPTETFKNVPNLFNSLILIYLIVKISGQGVETIETLLLKLLKTQIFLYFQTKNTCLA
jgi:hypothetical protein